MEILIDNPLATMYGPYFLIFFGFIIFFAVIILAIVKTQFDKTDNLPLPAIPPNIDPYEIAYLRGGTNEVARSVIFSLLNKGFIEIDSAATPAVIKKNTSHQNDFRSLNSIEQLAYGWLGAEREPKEVFGSYGLVEQLKVYGDSYQARLEQQQMLTSEADKVTFRPMKWAVYLLILALGGYKLLASVLHGYYNIIFLIVFLVAGLLIARAVAKIPRITKLGKAYLERLQTAFDGLKNSSAAVNRQFIPRPAPQATFAGVDPMLLSVGVFGSAVLAGTVYDHYNQAFQRSQAASSGGSCGGSACGSACGSTSSDSSSDSGGGGSSCSSSCGGGCGGGGCS